MRIILIAAVSVNGYIAHDTQDPIQWTSRKDKHNFKEVTQKAGVLIMGNTTYKTFTKPLPRRLTIVMTFHPENYQSIPGLVEFTNSTPSQIITTLKERGFSDVFIAGGSQIYSLFLQNTLVEELWLTLNPCIIKKGIPLFTDSIPSSSLTLLQQRSLSPSSLFLRYTVTTEGHQSDIQ